jgi:hypothetical protein
MFIPKLLNTHQSQRSAGGPYKKSEQTSAATVALDLFRVGVNFR